MLTQIRGSIDAGQGGLYKYDQGPIFPSMTPALRQTCLFWRQKTEICGSWNFSGNGPYGKIQTKQECSDLPQDYLAIQWKWVLFTSKFHTGGNSSSSLLLHAKEIRINPSWVGHFAPEQTLLPQVKGKKGDSLSSLYGLWLRVILL